MKEQATYLIPKIPENEFLQETLIVKKSKFIASIAHTPDVKGAKDFIKRICSIYPDARHNCFAYNAYKPNTTTYCGYSDDGEPKGTAGLPMLQVITHCGIGELTVVITRYFGGILLGTGGLVKAYQEASKLIIDKTPTAFKLIEVKIAISISIDCVNIIYKLCKSLDGQIIKQDFSEQFNCTISLEKAKLVEFENSFNNHLKNKGSMKILSQ